MRLLTASAAARAIKSFAPQRPNGTTYTCGVVGQSARAALGESVAEKETSAAATPATCDGHSSIFWISLLSWHHVQGWPRVRSIARGQHAGSAPGVPIR
jgi:hypothetical protein